MTGESGHMWVIATDEPRAVYNLAAFEVVLARKDEDGDRWSIVAADRDGTRAVLLARTESQQDAYDVVHQIANRLTALELTTL